jgi:hypothetical protein
LLDSAEAAQRDVGRNLDSVQNPNGKGHKFRNAFMKGPREDAGALAKAQALISAAEQTQLSQSK